MEQSSVKRLSEEMLAAGKPAAAYSKRVEEMETRINNLLEQLAALTARVNYAEEQLSFLKIGQDIRKVKMYAGDLSEKEKAWLKGKLAGNLEIDWK